MTRNSNLNKDKQSRLEGGVTVPRVGDGTNGVFKEFLGEKVHLVWFSLIREFTYFQN